MSFTTDKQTLDDLNLLGKYRSGSVYSLFNKVRTAGGERLLEEMFRNPLSDMEAINRRSELFAWFRQRGLRFAFGNGQLTAMEQFLDGGSGSNSFSVAASLLLKKGLAAIVKDQAYSRVEAGLRTTAEVLNGCIDFLLQEGDGFAGPYRLELQRMGEILADPRLAWIREAPGKLPLLKMAARVHLLQNVLRREMEEILARLYHLDVFITVGEVAKERGFSYAKALGPEKNVFLAEGLRHPGLEKGIGNHLSFRGDSNVLFLTGANMAGKSTLMKSLGIAVYLAHMGFPVAAEEMIFSVRDGLYSSINVPDNISLGYSHFYAEVLRVKQVAQEVSRSKRLVVLFDELFKGTNVKDAYDATLAVTEAFAGYRNSCFIISTHIIELGETLRQRCDNLQFSYLPTIMEGTIPLYTYLLQPGITSDRQGMLIIGNEKILELLQS